MVKTDDIRALVAPVLVEAGLECWDVEVTGEVLRVLVDRPGGVDLDGLAQASHTLSRLLDDHDDAVPGGRYELEVSSPGVERSLRRPEHFGRYLGTEVAIKTTATFAGARRYRGTLLEAGEASVAVATEGGERVEIPYAHIERARTVFVWKPASRPAPNARSKRHKPAKKLAVAAPNAKDGAR